MVNLKKAYLFKTAMSILAFLSCIFRVRTILFLLLILVRKSYIILFSQPYLKGNRLSIASGRLHCTGISQVLLFRGITCRLAG